MVITGSLNTICAKWADKLEAMGQEFHHPFLQATCMFIGEFLCMGAFLIMFAYKRYRWNKDKENGNSDGFSPTNLLSLSILLSGSVIIRDESRI
ncbi:unnamed protein product [Haemonchus placei]|uniref:WAT1-related protein n=1 Tax=Haemonchus placei TaxID=6290 RepID=A0A0N4WWX4_HAEPC|nr:unnamed protein product [Haemonchus placei]